MSKTARITVLVENTVHRHGLVAEHGLCFQIQMAGYSLLFDTGQTDLALLNAEALGIDLSRLDAVVLSHGHYDHTGGVPAILELAQKARVYLHPAAFEDKFSQPPGSSSRLIGMSQQTAQAIRHSTGGFVETTQRTQIHEDVFVTGEIPRTTPFEDTGGPFFLDKDGQTPDPLTDDQALVLDLGPAVIVLLGCAHAGVVNTLNQVAQLTQGKPVQAVNGGFHLGNAGEERIEQTLSRLRAANLDCLAPLHCTGWPATARLWQSFPHIYRAASVGTVFEC